MGRGRYKELGMGLFFGDYLYEKTVPETHFLRQFDELVKGEVFTKKLVHLCRRGVAAVQSCGDPEDAVVVVSVRSVGAEDGGVRE